VRPVRNRSRSFFPSLDGATQIPDVDGCSTSRALRRGIGYVIQQTGLFPDRTVEDNIATVPVLNGWRRARANQASGTRTDN
jgi:osmoprotectant transport system ATP-binding protein